MKKYTNNFKLKIVYEYQNGSSYKELKRKHGIPKTCLYEWLRLYKIRVHKDEKVFTYKQYEDLQKNLKKSLVNLKL